MSKSCNRRDLLIFVGGICAAIACSAGGESTSPIGADGTDPSMGGAESIPRGGHGAEVLLDMSGVNQVVTQAPVCIPEPFPQSYTCVGEPGPWAEALQKTLWFFNVNKSGPGVHCTDVQWRGDSHLGDSHIVLDPDDPNGVNLPSDFIEEHRAVLDPDGDNAVDLGGGYHDAGDYIKFTMTTAYAAAMLAWSLYEYPESFHVTGLADEALGQIHWASDYLLKATFRDDTGQVIAYAHQVADVSDHSCFWMPPEVRRADLCPRRAYFVWEDRPAADVTAAAAATLALTGLVTYHNRKTRADVDYAEFVRKWNARGGGGPRPRRAGAALRANRVRVRRRPCLAPRLAGDPPHPYEAPEARRLRLARRCRGGAGGRGPGTRLAGDAQLHPAAPRGHAGGARALENGP